MELSVNVEDKAEVRKVNIDEVGITLTVDNKKSCTLVMSVSQAIDLSKRLNACAYEIEKILGVLK